MSTKRRPTQNHPRLSCLRRNRRSRTNVIKRTTFLNVENSRYSHLKMNKLGDKNLFAAITKLGRRQTHTESDKYLWATTSPGTDALSTAINHPGWHTLHLPPTPATKLYISDNYPQCTSVYMGIKKSTADGPRGVSNSLGTGSVPRKVS